MPRVRWHASFSSPVSVIETEAPQVRGMKSAPIVHSLLAVVLGATSAGVTVTLLVNQRSAARDRETPALSVAPETPSGSEVYTLIQELRDENQALRERLTALELHPAPAIRAPVGVEVSKDAFEEFEEEVWARLAAMETRRAEGADLKSQVADAVKSLRKEEAVESVRRSQQKQAGRLEDRLARLSADLGLDSYQVNQMRSIFTTQIERNKELTRMWEEGTDQQVLGDTKRSYAEEHRAALESILTPQQLETYRRPTGGSAKRSGK